MSTLIRGDLPTPIMKALVDPYYEEGLAEHFEQFAETIRNKYKKQNISVTTLPRSPRQRQLFIRHQHRIITDPIAGFWRMFGQIVHSILEKYPEQGDIMERRVGVDFGGWWIHGQADRYTTQQVLQDWKLCKAGSIMYGTKDEYVAQLNVLAYLFAKNGMPVKQLQNVYLFRDWDARKVKEGSAYPVEPVMVVDIDMWPPEKTEAFIKDRLSIHKKAVNTDDESLPLCSDKERWMSEPVMKVFKLDSVGEPMKKAKALCYTNTEAEIEVDRLVEEEMAKLIEKNNKLKKPKPEAELKAPGFIIKTIKAKPTRCEYCEIAVFCSQRKAELAAMEPEDDEEGDEDG